MLYTSSDEGRGKGLGFHGNPPFLEVKTQSQYAPIKLSIRIVKGM